MIIANVFLHNYSSSCNIITYELTLYTVSQKNTHALSLFVITLANVD